MSLGQRIPGWVKQLFEVVVPRALFLPGLPRIVPTELRVSRVPLERSDQEKIRSARGPIAIALDPSLSLSRRLELPRAASAKADAAINLQLRQTLPGQAQGLLWRSSILRRDSEKIEYGVYILKQSLLDEVLTEVRRLDGQIEYVRIDAKGLAPIWERRPAGARTARNWVGFSALTVVLAGVVAVVGLALDRGALFDLVSARTARIEELEKRRDTLQAKAGEGEKAATAMLQDMSAFSGQSRRLHILADLTDALPDTVWVSELSISGDRLVLSGFSSSEVTDVITLLQDLPWAKDVQLNGTISFDSYSGQSRFEIGLLITPEAKL